MAKRLLIAVAMIVAVLALAVPALADSNGARTNYDNETVCAACHDAGGAAHRGAGLEDVGPLHRGDERRRNSRTARIAPAATPATTTPTKATGTLVPEPHGDADRLPHGHAGAEFRCRLLGAVHRLLGVSLQPGDHARRGLQRRIAREPGHLRTVPRALR